MKYKESELQIRCVKYFRAKYPAFAKLLFHPKNEESSGSRSRGAISKAQGVVAGVGDLILLLPSAKKDSVEEDKTEGNWVSRTQTFIIFSALALELKSKTGRQSESQKIFQRYASAAGLKYVLVRSYDEFTAVVDSYMEGVPEPFKDNILKMHKQIQQEAEETARKQFQKIINRE